MNIFLEAARQVYDIYAPGCAFPEWVLGSAEWTSHKFSDTKVYYNKEDSLEEVRAMATQREPCNIGMKRMYNEQLLEKTIGWKRGAYEMSTTAALMPNIAIYCHATVKRPQGNILVHVINLTCYAFDSMDQPDFKYFSKKPKGELLHKYNQMWKKALAAAKDLAKNKKINKIRIFNVGGGAFAGPFYENFILKIFEPSFLPLTDAFAEAGVEIVGYNRTTKQFENVHIPTLLDDPVEDVEHTLYVNAWDPWSLIGNGNQRDRSLDGYWGRNSNMAVLGWHITNPDITFIAV